LQALTAYFYARQYVPYERMKELFEDLFGLKISSGSLVNMIQNFAQKASSIYEAIRENIVQSKVIGADETGHCIKGKTAWAWVFQTPQATLIHSDKSRAGTVIHQIFPNGFSNNILVHDCWKPYFGVEAENHQICVAHLLRELKYFDKLYQQKWSKDFTNLIGQALELKKEMLAADYLQPSKKRTELEKKLDDLLAQEINQKYQKLVTFKKRMICYRDYLFVFLHHKDIPPDNNASERAVRTFKVKQKVSGLFRSDEGAKAYAVIRSVVDTAIKNALNVMNTLTFIAIIMKAE
jgi:hypothetical protein